MEKLSNADILNISHTIAKELAIYHKSILTTDEAAEYLGVSISHIHRLTCEKKIPFSKPTGRLCFFEREELERWALQNKQEPEIPIKQIDELSIEIISKLLQKSFLQLLEDTDISVNIRFYNFFSALDASLLDVITLVKTGKIGPSNLGKEGYKEFTDICSKLGLTK